MFTFALAPKMHSTYNLALEDMAVPPSWREALVVLIPKEGKDLNIPESYRTISLLNVDYKILASILASLLMKICQGLIGPDQSGFLTDRHLSHSIKRVINIINFSKKVDTQIMTYSSMLRRRWTTWNGIFCFFILEKVKFGQYFLKWIKFLYKEQWATIQYTGCHSAKINIKPGVRLGCPLSPLLFDIIIEMLNLLINQCNRIHGVQLLTVGEKHKTILYAVDIFFFVQQPIYRGIDPNY